MGGHVGSDRWEVWRSRGCAGLTDQEGQKMQQIVYRGDASSVRYRRAMMLLASAGGNQVPVIVQLVQASQGHGAGGDPPGTAPLPALAQRRRPPPDVLAVQRKERARIRSEKGVRWAAGPHSLLRHDRGHRSERTMTMVSESGPDSTVVNPSQA